VTLTLNTSTETILYPDIEPYATHQLAVDAQHTLYLEECGNPEGIPILFLHGGPGSHCKPHHRCLFNADLYRIILFDQRGTGRSLPTGLLKQNTTLDLIVDIEKIREYLRIENWVIFGSSWGSTLGLLYAQQYPEHVSGVILRGSFLARERDIHWFYGEGGVSRLFPEQWQAFMSFLPSGHWDNPLAIYYDRLTTHNQTAAQAAALAWASWRNCVVSFGQFQSPTACDADLLREAQIECHYAFQHFFIHDNQILEHIDKIADIPAILLHGQRDLVCPLENAYNLVQAWPAARLTLLPQCGHLADDEMLTAIIQATDEMARWITP